jgi:hypothetical protein
LAIAPDDLRNGALDAGELIGKELLDHLQKRSFHCVEPRGTDQIHGPMPEQEGLSAPCLIQIDCRDSIGHPFLESGFCEAHTQPIIKRAEQLRDSCVVALIAT